MAPAQPLAHGLEREGDLRYQDLGRAAGDPGMHGDPADVATHHLAHDHPVMGLGRGLEPVDGLGGDLHGGVEPEGHLGPREIVVDGLGYPHHREAPSVPRRSATPRVSLPPMATTASSSSALMVATTRSGPSSVANGLVRDEPRMVPPLVRIARQ